ncbi:hypothetical protein [Variovorax ginsengisoli]|uniref:Transmembrane protein n=1 Tax=Variovorax ginsengisoli TaxID=363844 RepID=A0ABT9SE44_9BURK|nr:hypothetical protein [Variovorax ginsengisoli]MDP9902634.1 hypothetical protein [Variovorax ginsengisoli]
MRRPPLTRAEIEHLSDVRYKIAQEVVKVNQRRRRRERREWWRARLKPVTDCIVVWLAVLVFVVLWSYAPTIDDGAEVVAADAQDYREAAHAAASPEVAP